jgi:hypothetical protein
MIRSSSKFVARGETIFREKSELQSRQREAGRARQRISHRRNYTRFLDNPRGLEYKNEAGSEGDWLAFPACRNY